MSVLYSNIQFWFVNCASCHCLPDLFGYEKGVLKLPTTATFPSGSLCPSKYLSISLPYFWRV